MRVCMYEGVFFRNLISILLWGVLVFHQKNRTTGLLTLKLNEIKNLRRPVFLDVSGFRPFCPFLTPKSPISGFTL